MTEELSQASSVNETPKTNNQTSQDEPGLGIASFVLSLWGLNVLALIFGIISLNQKNSRRTAKTGVIIASIRLGLRLIIIIAMGTFFTSRIGNHITSETDEIDNTPYYQISINDDGEDIHIYSYNDKERDITRKANLSTIATAIITSQQDRGAYPGTPYNTGYKIDNIQSNKNAIGGISVSEIANNLTRAGIQEIPQDPTLNKVYGLGSIDKNNALFGDYIYMVSTRNSVHNAGFILMASTETKDYSNWVVCNNGEGYIATGTDLRNIHPCDEVIKGEECSINSGLCTYTDENELRYIYTY